LEIIKSFEAAYWDQLPLFSHAYLTHLGLKYIVDQSPVASDAWLYCIFGSREKGGLHDFTDKHPTSYRNHGIIKQ
tara:strand:+ start:523 stop:747 length:225 start_codon:yes stop_codon:yes gene_type:complete